MDNIKIFIENPNNIQQKYEVYDISVYLNDIKLPHNIFNLIEVLPIYKYNYVEFDLFTCSCGVAGCAGFQNPIIQNIKDNIVTWIFPDSNDYVTDKKIYNFELEQFKKVFSELFLEIIRLENKNKYHATMIFDESLYKKKSNNIPFFRASKIKKSIKHYEEKYSGEQNFHNMLINSYPDFFFKKLKFVYNGYCSKEYYNLETIVCRVINQYPKKTKELAFLKKCQVAADSIIKFINGDKKRLIKLAYNSYEKYDLNSNSIIYFDFPEVKEEDFTFDKLEIIIDND